MTMLIDSTLSPWTLLVLCAFTFGLGQWWCMRKLNAALQKIDKLDRIRRAAAEYATQTRQQLGQLSIKLGANSVQQETVMPVAPRRPSKKDLEASLSNHGPSTSQPKLSSNGFADTTVA